MPPADLLLIFTKAYDLAEALGHASPLISPQTVVLTLQNGLGNYELLAQRVSPARVLAGSTSSGATLTAPGEILVAAIGETLIGSPAGDRALAAEVVEIFQQAHLPASLADNVDTVLWRKVLINAALNPLGALTRRHNGELLALPPLEIRTANAFSLLDESRQAGAGQRVSDRQPAALSKWVEVLEKDDRPALGVMVQNDFLEIHEGRASDIPLIIRDLRRAGAFAASMTGSGPACFGLFESQAEMKRAREILTVKHPAISWIMTALSPSTEDLIR